MKKISKRFLALALASVMVFSLAACGNKDGKTPDGTTPATGTEPQGTQTPADDTASYTYRSAVAQVSANWNPHTVQTEDDSWPQEYLTTPLYEFMFNDELHPVEGKEPFTGYSIVPAMAASEPVDVTEQVKAEHPEFNLPESATAGYAYTIDLNPNATWQDGTPINADTYIYSMQQLLDPQMINYRAADQYSAPFVIAGAEAYAYSGRTVKVVNSVDAEAMRYQVADLVKGDDGTYTTPDGDKAYFGLQEGYAWTGGDALAAYYEAGYIEEEIWSALSAGMSEDGFVPVTDDTMAALYQFTGSDVWGNEPEEQLGYYMSFETTYPEVDFSTVGFYKSGDYQITLVLSQSLSGFNLLYQLAMNSRSWLVYEDLYESCKKQNGDAWFSEYCSNVDTTISYGPYKMVSYQSDKLMRLEKNENWFGYTDERYQFVDPEDNETYQMYQTTAIECEQVAEAETRKMMFLKGELSSYGLGAEDFATYRNSEYAYAVPAETIFFFIFNGYKDAIQNREASEGFDKTKYDLETMTLKTFRQAVAVTYDKELFASTISPARTGAYGLVGTAYLYNAEEGSRYRDTDQAKQVLCDFYSVDTSQYASLDEAAASITGYDPEKAKELYQQAFEEALEAGYITDEDGDGICDQQINIEYCVAEDSDFMTKTIDYLNEKMTEILVGTGFEGKVAFVKSAPYGNDWSNKIKSGMSDVVLGGWSGSVFDPFGIIDCYTNPAKQYDANWFDATTVDMTLEVAGESITMNLQEWCNALNGNMVTVDGKDYNFGADLVDVEDRLHILAALEAQVLSTYNYIPMLNDGGLQLASQQVYYVVEEFNPVMSYGGIPYHRYNYSDTEWTEYVASQGGELKY